MTALTKNIIAPNKDVTEFRSVLVAAGEQLFKSAIVCGKTDGYSYAGSDTAGMEFQGICDEEADNSSGIDGAIEAVINIGNKVWNLQAAGASQAWVGQVVYIVDDQTVALKATTTNDIPVGIVYTVDSATSIWVLTLPAEFDLSKGLLATVAELNTLVGITANVSELNILDGVTAIAAELNLLAGISLTQDEIEETYLHVTLPDLSTAQSVWLPSPVAGVITKIQSIIKNAFSTADGIITTEINGTAVTGGGLTIDQAASAAGDIDVASPSALNVVAIGDKIEILTTGAPTDTTIVEFMLTIRRT